MLVLLVRSGSEEVAQRAPSRVRVVQQSSKIFLVLQGFTLDPNGTEPRPREGRGVFVPLHEVPRADSLFASYLEALKKGRGDREE